MQKSAAAYVYVMTSLFFVVVALFLLLSLQKILWPFILAFVLAYIFNPLVEGLEGIGISRLLSSFLIVGVFVIAVMGFIAILLPFLIHQINTIIADIPVALNIIHKKLLSWNIAIPNWKEFRDILLQEMQNVDQNILGMITKHVKPILANLLTLADTLVLVILVPVLLYYFLRDWNHLRTKFIQIAPPRYHQDVLEWMRFVNISVIGFMQGQLIIMVTLGAWYILMLSIIGLQNAFFIGFLTGAIIFIPYVGAFIGVSIATLIAIIQFGDSTHLLMVWGVYALGQQAESFILTPVIVGKKVGLHAAWIILSLLAGGKIFGFLGVLLAVPSAAAIGATLRFIFGRYHSSSYYQT